MTTAVAGKRILVAEDEHFIARSLATELRNVGADVLSPVGSVADAMALIAAERPDAAVLDVDLRGEMAFSVAAALIGQGVPVALATGYPAGALPSRYAGISRFDKPVEVDRLAAVLFPG